MEKVLDFERHQYAYALLRKALHQRVEAEEDIIHSYSLHANAYVTKPIDFERFSEALRQINDFFLTLVKLPN